jgi:hypothetical protein
MRIKNFRLVGIRCFTDTHHIDLSPRCNIFVGQNNVGKSTILKALIAFQGFPFAPTDIRPGSISSYHELVADGFASGETMIGTNPPPPVIRAVRHLGGNVVNYGDGIHTTVSHNQFFSSNRPSHVMVPFLARRKAPQFDHNIASGVQASVGGTFANLYSRIDLVATAGHPRHEQFQHAVRRIIGLPITTKATPQGKEAGFYLDDDNFASLDRIGDGITEMVALIVEMCLERNKVFVIEEPETNLHPSGLKALLEMTRSSSEQNQFIISTHSNIVVRELGFDEATKVFRVWRDGDDYREPSSVREVPRTPPAHIALLRELGYEFGDLGLHAGWLFLEESSAETLINKILIPVFAPKLMGRLRTFAAGGAGNVEPSVAEFQRLITFVHLEPAYEGRLWIRADGDAAGRAAVAAIRKKFGYLTDETCRCFTKPHFELYYPSFFDDRVSTVLQTQDKAARRAQKEQLLLDVLQWTSENGTAESWEKSASEPIEALLAIEKVIG